MANVQTAQVGDYGYYLEVDIVDQDGTAINIASATTKEIVFTAPDGSQTTKTATFVVNGVDGKIHYQLADGDLDQAGDWHVQGRVLLPGIGWRTGKGYFTVKDND